MQGRNIPGGVGEVVSLYNLQKSRDGTKVSHTSKNAHEELERALSLHLQGNKSGALKSLHKALELNLVQQPWLASTFPRNK